MSGAPRPIGAADDRIPEEVRMEPWDEHNRRLVDHVHPADWTNPTPKGRYHLVVLGAGTGGLVSAIAAASLGARVALIERHLMGGDCLNVGCVPSKGVISAARAWHDRGAVFGAPRRSGAGDFAKAMERMRRIRADIGRHDSARRFADAGVDVYLGDGRFVAPDAVEVAGTRLRFKRAVIATGARAAAPPIPGLDEAGYLTNETVFSLTELPERLLVIGAGPIGCEMAQSFAQYGSRVTLFDQAEHVLSRENASAAAVVQRRMVEDGVALELGVEVTGVERRPGARRDEVVVSYRRDDEEREAAGDRLLVAVGRKPNLDGLGLEAAGVEHQRDGVQVDDRLRTSNRRIFAVGDITPHLKFTHLADAHAGIVVQNALFFGRKKASSLVIPWCTYTSPEIAHVGLYEHQASDRGIAVETVRVPLAEVDRAILDGEDDGFLELVLEQGKDRVLGATLVAEHAGDMLPALCLAVTYGLGLGQIVGTIFPYPTQGEVLKKAAAQWRRKKLTPFAQKVFRFWFGKLFRA
ncbi:MAG TPA: mercuric reductase [Thermoanaerobaculia bacterium]|nr:mercuric reductase [Thermoanaerobaculia bacterium]